MFHRTSTIVGALLLLRMPFLFATGMESVLLTMEFFYGVEGKFLLRRPFDLT
jgi:hypothetical protein